MAPAKIAQFPGAVNRPPPDNAKLRELRDAVVSGRYRVDPDAIADALIRFEFAR